MNDDRVKSLASVWNLEVGVNVNDEFYVHFLGGYVVDSPLPCRRSRNRKNHTRSRRRLLQKDSRKED